MPLGRKYIDFDYDSLIPQLDEPVFVYNTLR